MKKTLYFLVVALLICSVWAIATADNRIDDEQLEAIYPISVSLTEASNKISDSEANCVDVLHSRQYPPPDWIGESNQLYAHFGCDVSSAGDVNGDGYADVIIGAHMYDNGQPDEGRAFLYYGSASGLSQSPDWTGESDQGSAYFGYAVASAGDVNGDGYSDVMIGAHLYDNGEPNEGRAFVYYGSASGLSQSPDWTGEPDQDSAYFGVGVACAGDVNGDGYSDVIIGAHLYDNGQPNEGRAFVYHGSASGLSQSPNWMVESDQGNSCFGYAVSSAGDLNASGFSDVIIGAHAYDNWQGGEGVAYVYIGSPAGLSQSSYWRALSDQGSAYFGVSVAHAGDVDGDGYSDVIIGAMGYDHPTAYEGAAFAYYGNTILLHNICALGTVEPSESVYAECTEIQPSALFRNTGIYPESNIPFTFVIKANNTVVYTSNIIVDSLAQQAETLVVFEPFSVGVCGTHYEALAFSSLPEDTFTIDDTTASVYFTAARIYELTSPTANAWKYPNADSGYVPFPTSPYWMPVTEQELQNIAALDYNWWVTAGALDEAHQDLQLYGIQLDVADTMIEALTVEWWGHHGEQIHHACGMYFWNQQTNDWSQRVDTFNVNEDVLIRCAIPFDSLDMFISDSGYLYAAVGADYNEVASCPLLFTHNTNEDVFIGDMLIGGVLGMWVDHVFSTNYYMPPDYDEYVKIDGEYLDCIDGKYHITINEMQQEVAYMDEVKLYVVDHESTYEIYPHEALMDRGYQGLHIHTSKEIPLKAALDEHGRDILHTLAEKNRVYAPLEKSGITGFAKPFTITLDLGELENASNTVLYMNGSTRVFDSDETNPAGDIFLARKQGMMPQNPRVEVIDASGEWHRIKSCGMPAGHIKTVTYPLYDENGKSIFESDDHRLRITFHFEVYIDKVWLSSHTASDYQIIELTPDLADLHYYGYADYRSADGKYPGEYVYAEKKNADYVTAAGYYTKYGDVKPLLDTADSKFVIMNHGDEISLEFNAQDLPVLPAGWQRDFIFASKGFLKMVRPGYAYAYSVDPLPFYGMRDDLHADRVGYYPYDPSPGLLMSILGSVFNKLVYDYPYSFSDALYMIKLHLTGTVKDKYPKELTTYCQEWNTRHVSAYYPNHYADAPPHLNLEKVPLYEDEGTWPTRLASLGIPFGDHSLHSNYFRVWLVTTGPIGVAEHEPALVTRFEVAHPNPFRKSTAFRYSIKSRTRVRVRIYEASGRLVRILTDEMQQPGSYSVSWDGTDNSNRRCAAGIYFLKFESGEHTGAGKLVFLR